MTWKELKIIVLQKVFAISDGKLVNDDTTREYLTALPGAANEGLQLLATAGRFLKKKLELTQEAGEAGVRCYDLTELVEDFYSLDADGVYCRQGTAYFRPGNWTLEAGRVLVLPAEEGGTWTLWYNAYPPELKADTAEDYELPLYPEMAALLPLYIASQVYKDDEVGVAVQYRNEFELGREALQAAARRGSMGQDHWRSTTGWW